MSEIRKWLESLGLGQYAAALEANDIDMDLLKQVDDQTLKDIGVASAGHRLRIRNAIAKLALTQVAEATLTSTAPPRETTVPSAERRQWRMLYPSIAAMRSRGSVMVVRVLCIGGRTTRRYHDTPCTSSHCGRLRNLKLLIGDSFRVRGCDR
jgi:SAM domain (Sterile alpha motif)